MIGAKPIERAQRATQHRPQGAQAVRDAIHELRSRGLGDYEVASATGLSVEYVRRILAELE
jgi:AraC-like DNA-binding protein